jgi:signal transduction histidine kinase
MSERGRSVLVRLLNHQRDAIAREWAILAQNLAGSHYTRLPAEEVQRWMAQALEAVIEALDTDNYALVEKHLTQISPSRLRMGFEMAEVMQALLLCKEAIFPFLWQDHSPAQEEAYEAICQLDNWTRQAIGHFSTLYAGLMQTNLNRLAVMEERQRLARELHDSVTQSLYSITLYAEAAARYLTAGESLEAADHMREVRDTAQEALREMRLLIFELRPPVLEQEGLAAALQTRLEAVEARAGFKAELNVEGDWRPPFEVEEALYRIAHEALNNVLKHAGASHVKVSLIQDADAVCLEVRDDGCGFDPETVRYQVGRMGLHGMKERAHQINGQLTLDSGPGRGTCVRVSVAPGQAPEGRP